ncbi:MAG: hypothetical protein AAF598_04835 [Bacteroidota bacterium]
MNTSIELSKQWIIVGASSGILAFLLFPVLLFVDLPSFLEITLAMLYGIFFSLSGLAIHHVLKFERPSVFTQIGALFIFCSGFLFNLMLAIQLTFRGYLSHFKAQGISPEEIEFLSWIKQTVDPIHLGIQLPNDFFTGFAMILFSIILFRHSFFGKLWGISGVIIAILLIGVKCWAFPMTPYELGFPFILGPMLAIWFLAVNIQCLRKGMLIGPLG